jgi:hypothetical protein
LRKDPDRGRPLVAKAIPMTCPPVLDQLHEGIFV